jgi:ubiquinone/menaquinone biosynthesis C-methylase UbiE
MSLQTRGDAQQRGATDEVYSIADHDVQESYVSGRSAAGWVPFFLPHLRPGMSLLDCGCGVGSITLDLAAHVAPGQVVGVDMDDGQLDVARKEAERRGIGNIRFEVGNLYELPFEDASFDAVLAHTVLVHLRDQPKALRALRRVLKPGGVICVSDDDLSTHVYAPPGRAMAKVRELMVRVLEYNGGSPFYSRNLRALLLDAGFTRTEGHAIVVDQYGTADATRRFAQYLHVLFSNPAVAGPIVSEGWASESELAQVRDGVLAWGERPDAFCAWMYCAAIGWVE